MGPSRPPPRRSSYRTTAAVWKRSSCGTCSVGSPNMYRPRPCLARNVPSRRVRRRARDPGAPATTSQYRPRRQPSGPCKMPGLVGSTYWPRGRPSACHCSPSSAAEFTMSFRSSILPEPSDRRSARAPRLAVSNMQTALAHSECCFIQAGNPCRRGRDRRSGRPCP
jgi:hypothetical protein